MIVNILCEAALFSRMHRSYSQLSQDASFQGPSASSCNKEETPHHHSPDVASEIQAAEDFATNRCTCCSVRSPRHVGAGGPRKPGHGSRQVIIFST